MPSLVSIVTPCYNGEKYIGRFLESIIRQSYSKLELVIINDGSTDETERVIYDYQEKLEQRDIQFVYQYQENAGQAAA
ncbi:MAG: glycosyltransferase family A protein, partial [Lachnospiraceae bacterium]|nr:glycosyltransferase family A protein [Lachnospiraceae bacterium]